MTAPYEIQSPERIAKDYGGNKQQIAQAAQMGLVDPTAAVLAGMFIDRMRGAQTAEQAPQQTVAQQVLSAPQMPPQGLGGTPEAAMLQQAMPATPPIAAPQQPMPQQMPQQMPMMANGGIVGLPIPDNMYDYAGGGIVAFQGGGSVEEQRKREALVRDLRVRLPGMRDQLNSMELPELVELSNRAASIEAGIPIPQAAQAADVEPERGLVTPGAPLPYQAGELLSSPLKLFQEAGKYGPTLDELGQEVYGGIDRARHFSSQVVRPFLGMEPLPPYEDRTGTLTPLFAPNQRSQVPQQVTPSTTPDGISYTANIGTPMGTLGEGRPMLPFTQPDAMAMEEAPQEAPQEAPPRGSGLGAIGGGGIGGSGGGMRGYVDEVRSILDSMEEGEGLKAYRKSLEEAESEIEKNKKQDAWAALAEFGFRWASSDSPYALQGMGEAGAATMPSIKESLKEARAASKEALKGRADLDLLKRSEQTKAIELGIGLYSKEQDRAAQLAAASMSASTKRDTDQESFAQGHLARQRVLKDSRSDEEILQEGREIKEHYESKRRAGTADVGNRLKAIEAVEKTIFLDPEYRAAMGANDLARMDRRKNQLVEERLRGGEFSGTSGALGAPKFLGYE